jgi:hypothetical protein
VTDAPKYLSRVWVYKCDWCGNEVESSMMTEQTKPVARVCLYCLCKSHPNLKAHLTAEVLSKVEEREAQELEDMKAGH